MTAAAASTSQCPHITHDRLRIRRILLRPILVLLALGLPFAVEPILGRSWMRVIDFALLYSLLALGLNISVGFTGLLDLGYIAFFAVGAYSWAFLSSEHFGLHLPFWISLPVGGLCSALLGVLLGSPTLRLRGDYLAIVTLGFAEIIRIFLNNLNKPLNITNGPQGITLIDPLSIGGFSFGKTQHVLGLQISSPHLYYYLLIVLVGHAIFVSKMLQNSRIGRAWVAIREDEVAAGAVGIDTSRLKLLAFALGATLAGISGGLFASFQGFISPESFNLMESIMILCMIVLGGMGNVYGVVLGAFILSVIPEALRYTGAWQSLLFGRVLVDPSDLRMLLFGIALVVMMLFRPAGLLPSYRVREELNPNAR